ncbi:AAA family ATPase [Azospirillum brasilense]|nr:AAA family ATPase [Azospirillum argentinense]
MAGLTKTQKDLRNVLLYTQELVTFNEKVIYDLAAEPHPSFHEGALTDLEGVDANVDPEIWLRLRRLRETQPPPPDTMFEGWVKAQPHPSPDKAPTLLDHRMLRLSIEEISDLAEAGLLDPDEVMRPRDADVAFPEAMDAILRTARMPEFRDAWRAYVEGPWAKWAEVEKPRRRSIEVYNRLYKVQQAVTAAGEDNAIELVWGIGVARWQRESMRISAPILEQLVELELLEDGTLTVGPRQVPPSLALKPFHALEVEGSKALQRDAGAQLERVVEDPDIAFSPFERKVFEPLLKSCAARLSASGIYLPDEAGRDPADRSLPSLDGVLRISDTWVLYVRQRAANFRQEDIQKLIKRVEEAEAEEDLPTAGLQFVKPPNDERLYDDGGLNLDDVSWRLPDAVTRSHGGGGGGANDQGSGPEPDFFFPLPYNDDQRDILKRLREADGVVVQGPPGTGKTHTIANVICHFLATGKRVLVTAKNAEALTALQEKLPPGIRDLAISVIHSDREGARHLEQAVQVLANEAKQINPKLVSQSIVDNQRLLADIRDRIAHIDAELLSYARRNLEKVESAGESVLPMELAKRVVQDRALHAWFEDRLDLDARYAPRFTDADIAEARDIRRHLAGDLAYGATDLPDPDALPDVARVLAAHGELARAKELEEQARSGQVPYMAVGSVEQARAVQVWLTDYRTFFDEVRAETWMVGTYQILLGVRRSDEAAETALRRALDQWAKLYAEGRELALKGIDTGDAPLDDPAFDAAVAAHARGEKPFGLFSFGKGALKERLARVLVGGNPPAAPEHWQEVQAARTWQREAQAFLRHWAAVCGSLGLPPVPTDWERGRGELLRLGRLIAALLRFASEARASLETLQTLFPYGLDARAVVYEGEITRALDALAANLEKADFADAQAVRGEFETLIGGRRLPFHAGLAEFASALGDASVAPNDLAEGWRQIRTEAERLSHLRPFRARLDEITDLVRRSGAPSWADKLTGDPAFDGTDRWTPEAWRNSWEWARADGFVRSIGDRAAIQKLADERSELETRQRAILAEVVRLRTFLGLKRALTGRIEAALAKFASAIAKLGAGTGKAAGRHRRVIRDATLDAADAVPCWILPEWRVAEQLPATLNAFDLVIVDEASQSDITALPAVLRGRKLLIVGDDKQVSPTPIGLDERTIIQLRTTYLTDLPFADQMDPATSLYELGSMVFPGKAVLLREHFRCVEPIIRFSARFYQNLLVPMRLPKATERLDPPLIDILVRDGVKTGDVNKRESDVIVDEVRRLSEDPAYEKRSIGIISLIGDKQAKLIYDRLMRELGAEVIDRHRIMCGSAATFQGQERDIIFLSMVACPKTAIMQRTRAYEQRYNVALSRARDRLVLVRSVTSSDLKPGDLKLQVIEHFRNPMGEGKVIVRKDVLDVCDSGFEREFGARLLDLGYRVRPQVPVGGRRIDFVVEGADDRRLAIELDGDAYHGPDRWAEDFRRQKALERLGWTFWRCWGSEWTADPDGCLADLKRTLGAMGIEPLGAEPSQGAWTEFREVEAADPSEAESVAAEPDPEAEEGEIAAAAARAEVWPEGVAAETLDPLESSSAAPPINPGDLVIVRYDDTPDRSVRVRISETEHAPEVGIIRVGDPLAKALLGSALEDEFKVDLGGGKTRLGVIERIERAPATV